MPDKNIKFAFLGSSRLSVIVLEELYIKGLIPSFIITTPDKPVGRKLTVTANVVKTWAKEKNIDCYDPNKLDEQFIEKIKELNDKEKCAVFLVASYSKIIPKALIDIPPFKTLNIHPSLLPQYRGPSPLPTAILDDTKDTGISIMVLDQEMDHGPIIAQKKIRVEEWSNYEDFEEMMAKEGAGLFAEVLPQWVNGEITAKEQDHPQATYTRKITKEDGLVDLNASAYNNFRKIKAFHQWPQAYFFIDKNGKQIRIKITEAEYKEGKLEIKKVIPEGKNEMDYNDFKKGYNII